MDTIYLLDSFVTTHPGAAYRLFPFGTLVKNGKRREITPEYAATFKLPHFKPPVKLGSHRDETPAGGHIIALEVRSDGLYAVPELNENGAKALADGAYRYHSPEVVWDDGGIEDPMTGEIIPGPLIIGDALLHTPHLGESAALYEIQTIEEKNMSEETYPVPKGIWDKFTAWLDRLAEPPKEPELPAVDLEQMTALQAERDEYKARLEAFQAEQGRKARVEKFEGELKQTKADASLAGLLADLTDEQAETILRQLRALSAQAEASDITTPLGSDAPAPDDPVAAFDSAIQRIRDEKKVDYVTALNEVIRKAPELYQAYNAATKKEK